MMNYRIGFGFDVHQLKEGLDFWVGGILLPHSKGGLGYSDADVLIHSICDALLGAANLGDIGQHFPDTDPKYKGIDSKILLQEVMCLVRENGYKLGNIDSTICLQRPKIGKHIPEMQKVLANCMGVDKALVSIKATTTEKLSFVGREEGISAYATVLIQSS
ncbi:MAG: 2-C-methyl-D-erythritol 2,4-cyclodiphosphate synthase [Flavobacteriales bacterium TMED123]|nr:MAG: 2-C-methyl-D-erythritol 2,4-cyclodiphosphate synthase [Flavobacteriales bacterium TMED123]